MQILTRLLVLTFVISLSGCQSQRGYNDMVGKTLASGTNRAFSHTVTTRASPEEVWRLWTDVSTWKAWDQGLKDAEIEGVVALGARGRIIPRSGPAARFDITEFKDGEAYAFETRLPFARLEVRRSFVSTNPVTFRHEVSFKGAFAGFWAGRLGPEFRAALPPTMNKLADLAEHSGAASR